MLKRKRYLWNELMYYLQSNTKNTADYNIAYQILKHFRHIPESKIDEFAYLTNVTPSTITKFCQKLGYDGFNELKDVILNQNEIETQISSIRKQYQRDQYEDAFLIFDSRLTTIFFEKLKNNDVIKLLKSKLKRNTNICVISPDYSANAVINFAKACFENDINCIKVARNTNDDLMLKVIKESNIVIIISTTGKWIEDSLPFLETISSLPIEIFVIGSNSISNVVNRLEKVNPIFIGEEDQLLNSHYNSSRFYSLLFIYLALQI